MTSPTDLARETEYLLRDYGGASGLVQMRLTSPDEGIWKYCFERNAGQGSDVATLSITETHLAVERDYTQTYELRGKGDLWSLVNGSEAEHWSIEDTYQRLTRLNQVIETGKVCDGCDQTSSREPSS